jgi:hypothetical protein
MLQIMHLISKLPTFGVFGVFQIKILFDRLLRIGILFKNFEKMNVEGFETDMGV